MQVRFTGKNMRITKDMKGHLEEKLGKIEKYAPGFVSAHAVLKKEKNLYRAEVTVHSKSFDAFGEGRERENVYKAVDAACDRVTKQLKKRRERIKDHHRGMKRSQVPLKIKAAVKERAAMQEGPDDEDAGPEVVLMRPRSIKSMQPEEASKRLELSGDPFLIFTNSSTKRTGVIFKRPDVNHGLFEA